MNVVIEAPGYGQMFKPLGVVSLDRSFNPIEGRP